MNAAIYTRVSTDDQAEKGYSLPSQVAACRKYAEEYGMIVIAEFQDSYTGTKLDRPGLDQLRDMITRRETDAVVVFSSDRWTRRPEHLAMLREELRDAGVELHYVNRGKSENTPEAEFTEGVEAEFNKLWRAKIIEGCRRGRRQKAQSGKWPGDNHPPYGYRRVGQGRDAVLEIDETEAQVIMRIFDLYIGRNGHPLGPAAIADALTAEGVPPPSRGKVSDVWYRSTILYILDRRNYIGEFTFYNQVHHFPDLVLLDMDTFEAAQRRRSDSRAVAGAYQRKHYYLLSGRIKCTCGWGLSGNPSKNAAGTVFVYYDCNQKRILPSAHHNERVRADIADAVVWNWLTSLLLDEDNLDRGLRRYQERREDELQPLRYRLEIANRLISENEKKVNRLVTELRDTKNDVIANALSGQLKLLARDLDALTAERDNLNIQLTQVELSEQEITEIKELAAQVVHLDQGRVRQRDLGPRRCRLAIDPEYGVWVVAGHEIAVFAAGYDDLIGPGLSQSRAVGVQGEHTAQMGTALNLDISELAR